MIITSAPATLMICGEHSVLRDGQAIVCAVKPRLSVKLEPREDQKILINSMLGEHQTDLKRLEDHPKFRFILQALRDECPQHGLNITVDSQINPTMGLGSSAAVIVAMVAALAALNNSSKAISDLHAKAMNVLLSVQKRGSGADLAAALHGGMIFYQKSPFQVRSLPTPPAKMSLRYAGYKTPTAEVLALLAEKCLQYPEKFAEIYQAMSLITPLAVESAENKNWTAFYQQLKKFQIQQDKLGVCDEQQRKHIAEAEQIAQVAKISGSGLGDCIIAFSETLPPSHTAIAIDNQGVTWEI